MTSSIPQDTANIAQPTSLNHFLALPDELLAEIFLFTHHSLQRSTRFAFPYLLLRVSRLWNSVCLHTPQLWTYFLFYAWAIPDVAPIKTQLERSGRCLLDIDLTGDVLSNNESLTVKALRGTVDRWRSLHVVSTKAREGDVLPRELPWLEELSIYNTQCNGEPSDYTDFEHIFKFPSLKCMNLVNVDLQNWESCVFPNVAELNIENEAHLSVAKLSTIASSLPNLKVLSLRDVELIETTGEGQDVTIQSPALRSLTIKGALSLDRIAPSPVRPLRAIEKVLNALRAPGLEELVVGWEESMENIKFYEDAEESKDWPTLFPKLAYLSLEDAVGPEELFSRFFCECPHVKHLTISQPSFEPPHQWLYTNTILQALSDTSFVGHLETLSVDRASPRILYRCVKGTLVKLALSAEGFPNKATIAKLREVVTVEMYGEEDCEELEVDK